MSGHILIGDALEHLRTLPDESARCCVTSPPYFGLRDYGTGDAQIGLEQSPAEYIERIVDVFREVRRVLADDGTLWLNLGDSYNNAGSSRNGEGLDGSRRGGATGPDGAAGYKQRDTRHALREHGIKHKDLMGIPWRVALALQADGWYLRSDIIWHKTNPMPESVRDRPTKSHEYVFLLTKGPRYYYDSDSVREPSVQPDRIRRDRIGGTSHVERGQHSEGGEFTGGETRNRRSVWTVATRPFKGAHFATFPPALIEPCILAGSEVGDTVLDPFFGAGTTALVAEQHGRHCVGIELNPEYAQMAVQRIVAARQGETA